jgi:hypothetical protein
MGGRGAKGVGVGVGRWVGARTDGDINRFVGHLSQKRGELF